ncbi:DUF1566 domain-containing protein [Ideonella sp.]|uniref:Lcl C-terminal domain-containing protein n=1 Tax=Ideonella sp. TaxID=1929293 RepID=UPI0035AE7D86
MPALHALPRRSPAPAWCRAALPLLAALCGGALPAAPALAGTATGSWRLNDTGLTRCVVFDPHAGYVFTPDCTGSGHDGEFGRDPARPNARDGHAGFSFEKTGAHGEPLPRQAADWSCVRDRVTGLMWEVKTGDGGPRDAGRRFRNQGDGQAGDASAYVAEANAAALCGATDWRLPTRRELESLMDFSVPEGGPLLDRAWFPHSPPALHWTSTPAEVHGGSPTYRWAVNFYSGGTLWYGGQYGEFAVRLVRGGATPPQRRWQAAGAELRDRTTGLVWRRCAEGQAWTGSTCNGSPTTFLTIRDAVAHAQGQALSAGQAWRVPNIKELASLAEAGVQRPAIDTAAFRGFQTEAYHSGTHWTENPVYSWRINFADGGMVRDHWGGKLLLVRDGD